MNFGFELASLPGETVELRAQIRSFVRREVQLSPVRRALSWAGYDPEFSRKLGAMGWIGMTWPRAYGGGERSELERYVLLEEMLAAGAPVGCHWIADRQSGPLLLRHGTETQRESIIPAICRGECYFCIGMSEPDSGSDLASVRTRAEHLSDGWRLNGTKLWTSGADQAHFMIALVRTSGTAEDRHHGLSQMLVELSAPGIEITPIPGISSVQHFHQVRFSDVLLPEDALLGIEGLGWSQVTSELAYERSGPERFLSSLQALLQLLRALPPEVPERVLEAIGESTAELMCLRQMSLAVASKLQEKRDAGLEAALVKDLGALFEQRLPDLVADLAAQYPALAANTELCDVLDRLRLAAPAFSLRGGTREILRGIIARGLGLR